jgi:hypothetical protein
MARARNMRESKYMGQSNDVAQVSKPAVSPVSKPAGHGNARRIRVTSSSQAWTFIFQKDGANSRPERPQYDIPEQRLGMLAIKRGKRATSPLTRTHSNDVAQVSKPAVSPVSKPARHGNARRIRVTPSPQFLSPSLHGSTAPAPVFWPGTQASRHGVISDVPGNALFFFFVSNPVIVGFPLPERLVTQTDHLFGPARTELLPRFENIPQQMIGHRPDNRVNMVWHYHPFIQQITAYMEVPQGVGQQIANVRATQMAGSRSPVKMAFHLASKIPCDFFHGIIDRLASFGRLIQSPQPFVLFLLKLQHDFLRQGIRKSKSDKIGSAFAFHMRQIATAMDAGAKRVCIAIHTVRSQLMTCAIQAGARLVWLGCLHKKNVTKATRKSELNTWSGAVFKLVGRGLFERATRFHALQVWKPALHF